MSSNTVENQIGFSQRVHQVTLNILFKFYALIIMYDNVSQCMIIMTTGIIMTIF